MSTRRYYYGGWAPYVSIAQKRRHAGRKLAALKKKGKACQPVAIEGRTIAATFWGKAWCDNLEAYSDYENRLPRGRSYVRNGSVIDLRIETGKVSALVSGSDVYNVVIGVEPLEPAHWKKVVEECAGKIDSLIELLQGRLSQAVMGVVTRRNAGLFPTPRQISFRCSCPDWASMCKHVAATLYGVGARLDRQPELLFQLRHVDPQNLIQQAESFPPATQMLDESRKLDTTDLSGLFGIEIDDAPADSRASAPAAAGSTRAGTPSVDVAATAAPRTAKPRATKPSSSAAKPTAGRRRHETITARDLAARGIPNYAVQNWIRSGVLMRSGERGVYRTTRQTAQRIAAYAAR